MSATIMELDFRKAPERPQSASGVLRGAHGGDARPVTPEGKLLTPKQIRARARRRAARASSRESKELLTEQEFNALYKPVEEWDLEELARGRPRNVDGNFVGRKPQWVTRQVHESAMDRFKGLIREGMNANAAKAQETIEWILTSEEVDEKGKPVVSPSTKLDAYKFLMEHIVGKPTQRVEADISVKLQALLGVAMVNPAQALAPSPDRAPGPSFALAHLPGTTMPMGEREEGDDDEILEGELVDG